MFCDKCGIKLNENAVFCSICGHRVQATGDYPSRESVKAPSQRSRPQWTVLLSILTVFVLISGGVYWFISNQKAMQVKTEAQAAAKNAVDVVGRLNSALGVGVVYKNYMTILSEAAAAIEAYQPNDAIGARIRDDLTKAVRYYAVAGDVWGKDIQGEFDLYNYMKIPEIVFYNISILDVRAEDVRQIALKVAGEAHDRAKMLVINYDNADLIINEAKEKENLQDSQLLVTSNPPDRTSEKPIAFLSDPSKGGTGEVIETMIGDGMVTALIDLGDQEIWISGQIVPLEIGEIISFAEGVIIEDFYSKLFDKNFEKVLFVEGFLRPKTDDK